MSEIKDRFLLWRLSMKNEKFVFKFSRKQVELLWSALEDSINWPETYYDRGRVPSNVAKKLTDIRRLRTVLSKQAQSQV